MGSAMSHRLWYPQLDVYDAIRRQGALLALWTEAAPPSPERLYIADFYLANPPLLHRTQMTRDLREAFQGLRITKADEAFIAYPSAPILFQKMEAVQLQALHTLTGKGLVDLDRLSHGEVRATSKGRNFFSERFLPLLDREELRLATFLSARFAAAERCDMQQLRATTGLRRVAQ